MVPATHTPRISRAVALLVSLLLLAAFQLARTTSAGATLVAATSSAGSATSSPASSTAMPAHPYSAPVWYPLGAAASADCYRDNPGCNGYHGYWAMDIDSKNYGLDEPVYALGAGQVHIGRTGVTCDGSQDRGNWVWVDHGAGVVSLYGHLGSIAVGEGQWVSPRTQLGTVGNSGYSRCAVNHFRYLYVGVKHGGINGTWTEVPTMQACQNGQAQTWPSDLDPRYPTWNSVVQTPLLRTNLQLPATTRDCIPTDIATPQRPAAPRVSRAGTTALTVAVPADTGLSRVTVEYQKYLTSKSAWSSSLYESVSPGQPLPLTGLTTGRNYRFRLFTENAVGPSAPSGWTTIAPAGAPAATTLIRGAKGEATTIRFAWQRNADNGSPITRYEVTIRRLAGRTFTKSVGTKLAPSLIHYNWYHLRRHTTYQVATRAVNRLGASPWVSRTVRTT